MKRLLLISLCLLAVGVSKGQNIAQGKTATQSSSPYGDNVGGAAKAVDGNTNSVWVGNSSNSVTHTNQESNPWWKVDLSANYDITKIKVYNRTACCPQRLNVAKVFVGNTNSTDPNDYTEVVTLNSGYIKTLNLTNATGRYVMVRIAGRNKILSMAEGKRTERK